MRQTSGPLIETVLKTELGSSSRSHRWVASMRGSNAIVAVQGSVIGTKRTAGLTMSVSGGISEVGFRSRQDRF
jgi:hypothetical protein